MMSAPVPAAWVRKLARLQPRGGQLRLGLLQRDLKRRRIDPEQHVAALHMVAVLDRDLVIGPLTCALTETMSCFTAALSVSTVAPLVSHQ